MTDSNGFFGFPTISFHRHSLSVLRTLLLALGKDDSDASAETNNLRKTVTSILTEINCALVDDSEVFYSFGMNLDFLSILLKCLTQKFSHDRKFCNQSALFFNLVHLESSQDSSLISLQAVPFFLEFLGSHSDLLQKPCTDAFISNMKSISVFTNSEVFIQSMIRNRVFQTYVIQVLQFNNDSTLLLMKLLFKSLQSKYKEQIILFLSGLAPTLEKLSSGNSELSIMAGNIRGCLKIDTKPKIISSTIACKCKCGQVGRCKFQEEVFQGTYFIAPTGIPNHASEASELFGTFTGKYGFLCVDPTIVKDIWNCTLRFVESKGMTKVGIASISKDFPHGKLSMDSLPENLAYGNSGQYDQGDTSENVAGDKWKMGDKVRLEVDMNKKQICFYVNETLKSLAFTHIPDKVRVFVWGLQTSMVHIVKFAKASTSTKLGPATRAIEWDYEG